MLRIIKKFRACPYASAAGRCIAWYRRSMLRLRAIRCGVHVLTQVAPCPSRKVYVTAKTIHVAILTIHARIHTVHALFLTVHEKKF